MGWEGRRGGQMGGRGSEVKDNLLHFVTAGKNKRVKTSPEISLVDCRESNCLDSKMDCEHDISRELWSSR